MTKRARLFLQSTLLATLMAGLFVPDASAGGITISFSGTVTGPGTGAKLPSNSQGDPVLVGDTISGYFTYNSGGRQWNLQLRWHRPNIAILDPCC